MKIKKKFSPDETSQFCEQLAILLNGGIPVYEGVYILYHEMEDSKTKDVLGVIDEKLKSRISLNQALMEVGVFPEYMVHMINIGETTGKLEEVLKSLSEYYERESNVKSSIKSAVAFPAVLFVMMSAIMLLLVVKILPMFEEMFNEINKDIASKAENMMSFGITAGKIASIVMIIILILLVIVLLWYQTKHGAIVVQKLALHIKPARRISEKMATGSFISSMALMITSGMELGEAITIAGEACMNQNVKKKILKCSEMVYAGHPFDEAIREAKLIVGMDNRMISVGSKTGSLDAVFTKLSSTYQDKTTELLGNISSIIETMLVVILALLIGTVLISVMFPLVSIISSIG